MPLIVAMELEEVQRIFQSSSNSGSSTSYCLVSYPEHSLGETYLSAEIHSVYSTTPADRATETIDPNNIINFLENKSASNPGWRSTWKTITTSTPSTELLIQSIRE